MTKIKYKKVHLLYRAGRGPFTLPMMISRAFRDIGWEVIPSNTLLMTGDEISKRTQEPADFILSIGKGGILPKIIKGSKTPTVLWIVSIITDSPGHLQTIKKYASMYNKIYCFSPTEKPLYKKNNIDIEWLPMAADSYIHTEVDMGKDMDVGFYGSLSIKNRNRIIEDISKHYETYISTTFSHYVQFINRTRINLNIGWGFFGNQMRIFEVLGCGGFLLTNEIPEKEKLFKDGEHLVYFTNNTYLELIEYFLKNIEERKKISTKGRQEVLKNHLYKHRLKKIISQLEKI